MTPDRTRPGTGDPAAARGPAGPRPPDGAPEARATLEAMATLSATWFPDAMGDPAVAARWVEVFDDDVTVIEPASLPHGGRHRGLDAFRSLQEAMGRLWAQQIEEADYWLCAPDRVVVRIVIRWTARPTGRSVVLPMVDLLRFRDGKVVEVEAFLHDTRALLATLEG